LHRDPEDLADFHHASAVRARQEITFTL
jgi:hypothetical protein